MNVLATSAAATGVTPEVLRTYYSIGSTVGQAANNSQVRLLYCSSAFV